MFGPLFWGIRQDNFLITSVNHFRLLIRVALATAFMGLIGLTASEEAGGDSVEALLAELQALPPELREALPEDLRQLLEEMKPGGWQTLLTVKSALGHRENVGLSSVAPASATFGQMKLEALAMRQPEYGLEWLGLVDGQARWYGDNPVTDDEHFWFGRGEVRWTPWAPFQLAGVVQAYWQDQVIDLTEGIGARTVANLQVAGGELSLEAQLKLFWGFRVMATSGAIRTDYRGVGEDYEGVVNKGELIWAPTKWLTVGVGAGDTIRDYDFRGEATAGGRIIADTLLSYDQGNEMARLTLNGTLGGDWKLEAKGSRLDNRDGASGFYDYERERWSGALSWEGVVWEIRAEFERQDVRYGLQTVGDGLVPEIRTQNDESWSVDVIYRWGDHWEVFGEFLSDQSRSNEVDASYRDRTVLLGLAYTF